MKAVLLAAGLGTRLRPLTDTSPKCLVPIGGRPLLEIWLDSLSQAGIGPILVNTHYLPEAVERHVTQSVHRTRVNLVHEPELLGTGGTLLANRDFFGHEAVMLAHADNFCRCQFRAFELAHRRRPAGTVVTMMTFRTDTPQSCGIVELDRQGVVVGFYEKVSNPPDNLANGAVYIVEPAVLDFMAALASRTIDFSTEVLPAFVGRIFTWHNHGLHFDIGTLTALEAARRAIQV